MLDHGIKREMIDVDALKVIARLKRAGFHAYVVGGAVRDLLLQKSPKDIDLVTNARPKQIWKLFRNSRIIGHRFQIVHVVYKGKIIEVSTFRSSRVTGRRGSNNNSFGTIEDDVHRRDFSINALYYSPDSEEIIDYVGGYNDIHARVMRSLLPLDSTFVDDPVRLIRAIKYSCASGFKIPHKLKTAINHHATLIKSSSTSRLTEEVIKILQSGYSEATFELMIRFGILAYMLPNLHEMISIKSGSDIRVQWLEQLKLLDKEVLGDNTISRSRLLYYFMRAFWINSLEDVPQEHVYEEVCRYIKTALSPMTPPNREVGDAAMELLQERGIAAKRRSRRMRRHN